MRVLATALLGLAVVACAPTQIFPPSGPVMEAHLINRLHLVAANPNYDGSEGPRARQVTGELLMALVADREVHVVDYRSQGHLRRTYKADGTAVQERYHGGPPMVDKGRWQLLPDGHLCEYWTNAMSGRCLKVWLSDAGYFASSATGSPELWWKIDAKNAW